MKRNASFTLAFFQPLWIIILGSIFFLPMPSYANEPKNNLLYHTLTPELVTNYPTTGKRLGYVRLTISLMYEENDDEAILMEHTALIRDILIQTIGQQSQETIRMTHRREEWRQKALQNIQNQLTQLTGKQRVLDLLFTKYLYQ